MNLVSFFFKDDEAEELTEEKEELPDTNGAANTALTPVVKNVPSESKTAIVEAPTAIKHPETEPSTLVIHSLTETPAKTFSVKLPSSPPSLPKCPVPGPSAAVEAKPLVVEKVASKPTTPSKSPLPTVAEKKISQGGHCHQRQQIQSCRPKGQCANRAHSDRAQARPGYQRLSPRCAQAVEHTVQQ